MDLIDTWWNVKAAEVELFHARVDDLIDTWWNVKLSAYVTQGGAINRFNRYMVECEEDTHKKRLVIRYDLIDTWWNVKIFALIAEIERRNDLIDTWWNVKKKEKAEITPFYAI